MGKKILIIEDDPDLVERFEKRLIEAGFEVSYVSNTLDAYSVLVHDENEAGFDLAVIDLMMPAGFLGKEHPQWQEHGGMCIANELVREQIDIPFLVYTHDDSSAVAEELKKMGVPLFLKKPETSGLDQVDTIVAKVEEMLK